jgi:cell division protein FtsL
MEAGKLCMRTLIIAIAFLFSLTFFCITVNALVSVSCSVCYVNNCNCSIANCTTGATKIYNTTDCSGIAKYQYGFSNASLFWNVSQTGKYYFKILCSDGNVSSCNNVTVNATTTSTTSTTGTTTPTTQGPGPGPGPSSTTTKKTTAITTTKKTTTTQVATSTVESTQQTTTTAKPGPIAGLEENEKILIVLFVLVSIIIIFFLYLYAKKQMREGSEEFEKLKENLQPEKSEQ